MIYHRHRTNWPVGIENNDVDDHKGAAAFTQPNFSFEKSKRNKRKNGGLLLLVFFCMFGLGQMSWSTFTNIFVVFG